MLFYFFVGLNIEKELVTICTQLYQNHSGPLCELPQFCPAMLKWCSMHCLNLGTTLWICGSAMRCILDDYDFWGPREDQTENQRLAYAYELFRRWTRKNKVQFLAWINALFFSTMFKRYIPSNICLNMHAYMRRT